MLEFKKYSSIENSFSREFMEHVVAEMPQNLEYVVQEKVHGANTSFLCDGETVRFAKRTSILEADEQFYNYPELLERYRERVLRLFSDIKAKYPEVTHISVFGEMFGGLYPHDGVQKERKNERFAEKKSVKKRNKLFAEPVPYSEALQALIAEGEAYVTENRLTNVVSHIGEVHFPKDFGKVMGLLSKDVLDDFLKEHGGSYAALDKCEQKSLNKELNKLCTALVKQVYMSQAYIIE